MDLTADDLARELQLLDEFHAQTRGQRVGVVYGTLSREDRLYLERAPQQVGFTAIMDALRRLGYDAVKIDPTLDDFEANIAYADMLFLNIHGEFGEDGRLQGLLDFYQRGYTGSGVLASALGMNKVMFKRVVSAGHCRTPRFARLDAQPDLLEMNEVGPTELPLPAMAKPVSGGSSIGIKHIRDSAALAAFLVDQSFRDEYGPFFLEQFIQGTSITVGVLELATCVVTTPPIEAKFSAEFYDEATKLDEHGDGLVEYAPCELPDAVMTGIRRTALKVHRLIGCRGFSRTDFIKTPNGDLHTLEINTLPGMATSSNFPAGTAALGLTYDQTILAMLRSCLWSSS